jgi:hypothetical protein
VPTPIPPKSLNAPTLGFQAMVARRGSNRQQASSERNRQTRRMEFHAAGEATCLVVLLDDVGRRSDGALRRASVAAQTPVIDSLAADGHGVRADVGDAVVWPDPRDDPDRTDAATDGLREETDRPSRS